MKKFTEAVRQIFTSVLTRRLQKAITVDGKKTFVRMAYKFLSGESVASKEVDLVGREIDWRGLVLFLEPPAEGGPFIAFEWEGRRYLADTSDKSLSEENLYAVLKPQRLVGKCVFHDDEDTVFEANGEKIKFPSSKLLVAGRVVGYINITSL